MIWFNAAPLIHLISFHKFISIFLIFKNIFFYFIFQQMKHINFDAVLSAFVNRLILFNLKLVYLLLFRKIGNRKFWKISSCVYDFNWHELPIDLQKNFVLIIQNTQRPLFYHGFNVIVLNLETFTGVSKINIFLTFFFDSWDMSQLHGIMKTIAAKWVDKLEHHSFSFFMQNINNFKIFIVYIFFRSNFWIQFSVTVFLDEICLHLFTWHLIPLPPNKFQFFPRNSSNNSHFQALEKHILMFINYKKFIRLIWENNDCY